jgi:ankyrin repeat protein
VDTRLQSSLLLKRGADVESEYEASRTPLSYAAERGHKAVVELLLVSRRQKEKQPEVLSILLY